MKKFNYLFQAILIYIFFFIGRLLGLNISRFLFSNLFCLFGPIFKSKKIVKKNLDIFSENLSNTRKKEIVKNMWKNYGMTFIEYIFLNFFRKKNNHITIYGEDVLSNIVKKGKPVIFISGHFANFELMSMEITKKNIPLATIYRPLNNVFLNPLMEHLRRKYVCRNQIKKGIKGVRETINYLNKKTCIALMIDQRLGEGEKINFFNKPALTTTLPAQLSLKFNLAIIPVLINRKKDENFKIEFMKKISPENFKDKSQLTKKINETLEELIVKNSSQWIWTHNRWKQ